MIVKLARRSTTSAFSAGKGDICLECVPNVLLLVWKSLAKVKVRARQKFQFQNVVEIVSITEFVTGVDEQATIEVNASSGIRRVPSAEK